MNFLFNAFDFVSKVLPLHPDKINESSIVALDVGCGPYGIIGQLAAKLFRWQVKYTGAASSKKGSKMLLENILLVVFNFREKNTHFRFLKKGVI